MAADCGSTRRRRGSFRFELKFVPSTFLTGCEGRPFGSRESGRSLWTLNPAEHRDTHIVCRAIFRPVAVVPVIRPGLEEKAFHATNRTTCTRLASRQPEGPDVHDRSPPPTPDPAAARVGRGRAARLGHPRSLRGDGGRRCGQGEKAAGTGRGRGDRARPDRAAAHLHRNTRGARRVRRCAQGRRSGRADKPGPGR